MSPRTLRRPARLVLALVAVWTVAAELENTLVPGLPDLLAEDLVIVGLQCTATALVALRGVALAGRERWGWLLLGAGLACWEAGNLFWLVTGDAEVPIPSWGDAGFLGCIPLAFAGLVALAAARERAVPAALWLDGLVAALAAAALSATLVFDPVAARADGAVLEVATNLAYPIGDLALLAVVVAVLALRGWRLERTWALLGLAVLAFWGADSMYLLATAADTYEIGVWFDLGWLAATVLFAAAAWFGGGETASAGATGEVPTRLAVMPAVFALVSLALLVASGWRAEGRLGVALAGASLVAVLARLVEANRRNAALLLASRAEARTDSLTGLANRRALLDDLAHAAEDARRGQRLSLALFDLDGFKAYNDGFGHPAGDALLRRRAAELGRAVDGRGRAYRLGGDEFCVLVGAGEGQALAAAGAALGEEGPGFAIAASRGDVALPADAVAPEDVLRLADERMYEAKRARRAARAGEAGVVAA